MFGGFPVYSALVLFLLSISNNSVHSERVVCGFSVASIERSAEYGFEVADIPISLCTHVVYDRMEIDLFSDHLFFGDTDDVEKAWKSLAELKHTKPELKLLGAVRSPFLMQVAAEKDSRGTLIENILEYMERYQLDGIELICSDTGFGPHEEFYMLIEELKSRFTAAGHSTWEVNVLIEISRETIDRARLCRLADFVHVMGMGERKPINNEYSSTPMAKATFDINELKNITLERALQYWIDNSCPADKMVLGVFFMAQTFTIANGLKNGEEPEELMTLCSLTKGTPLCSYVELCQIFKESEWTMGWDDMEGLAPHAIQGDRWIAYENEASVGRKGEIARSKNLAGVFVFSLSMDDYRNKCGTLYPLTKALIKSFNSTTLESNSTL
uniref:Glyco_18 domain-containing protein n=1 Tax=Anopheles funestus TaxID=62324 RepID=A0A4Y0BSH3_ANOFN